MLSSGGKGLNLYLISPSRPSHRTRRLSFCLPLHRAALAGRARSSFARFQDITANHQISRSFTVLAASARVSHAPTPTRRHISSASPPNPKKNPQTTAPTSAVLITISPISSIFSCLFIVSLSFLLDWQCRRVRPAAPRAEIAFPFPLFCDVPPLAAAYTVLVSVVSSHGFILFHMLARRRSSSLRPSRSLSGPSRFHFA